MRMQPKLFTLISAAALCLSSCSDDKLNTVDGEGKVLINSSLVRALTEASSRAGNDASDLTSKLHVVISTTDGTPYRYWQSGDEIPWSDNTRQQAEFSITHGDYIAECWTGDSVSASFDDTYYKGQSEFTVTAGSTSQIDVTLKIANVGFRVNYDADLDNVLKNYTLEVGHKCGSLQFEGRDTRTGYFMMPKADKNLTWALTGSLKSGETYRKEGVIENAEPGMLYVLNVKYNTPADIDEGAVYFDPSCLTFEEVTIPNNAGDAVGVRTRPVIELYEGQQPALSSTVNKLPGVLEGLTFLVRSSGRITDIQLSNPDFESLLGADKIEMLSVPDNNIIGHYYEVLRSNGYSWEKVDIDEEGTSYFRLSLSPDVTRLFPEGYITTWTLSATDEDWRYLANPDAYAQDKRTVTESFSLRIVDSGAQLIPSDPNDPASIAEQLTVWDNQYLLKAEVLKDDTDVTFKYKKSSADSWITLAAVNTLNESRASKGQYVYAIADNLEPATDYDYCIDFTTGDISGTSDIYTFRSKSQSQLPNAGFETWAQLKRTGGSSLMGSTPTVWCAASSLGDLFWDSGNTGAAAASATVTTYDEGKCHGGSRSAYLYSQKALTQFAAGNIFIGEYLNTEMNGITGHGILGWGRPFTGRPRQLKGWVRYEGGTVNQGDGSPRISKGDPDRGIIYIALLDNSKAQGDTRYPDYPVVVRTKDTHLFNPEGSDVIAYGEITFSGTDPENTAGLREFTVDLNYRRSGEQPSYILLTASASIGGDYFTGYDGSKMWIDDLELVY